jgi:hypothetical protein
MALELLTLFQTEKLLAIEPNWVEQDSEGLMVLCPIEVDGVTIEGFQFRATARKRLPDEMLVFQIEYHPPAERGGPLARIEWKPLSSHNNKGNGPPKWRNQMIRGCHYHRFDLNLKYAPKALRQGANLPIAVPLDDSPENFYGLLDLVKKEFRINNIEWLAVPPWEPSLI